MRVSNHKVASNSIIRYLGIIIDAKLSFEGHLDYARKKATSSLARMTAYTEIPKYSRHLLITEVVLYAIPVWESTEQRDNPEKNEFGISAQDEQRI